MNQSAGRSRRASILVWATVALVIVLIVWMGKSVSNRPPEEKPLVPERAVPVRTLTLTPQMVADVLPVPGSVEAMADVILASETGGRVMEILVDRGHKVAKGQVLLRLDSRVSTAVVKRMKIELREAERDLGRWQEMKESGAVATSELDQVKRRRDLAEVGLTEAEAFLSKCTIESPMEGMIESRMMEVGEYAMEGGAAFRIVDIERVKIAFDVPEKDIFALVQGKTLEFRVLSLPDTKFKGEISFVSSAARKGNNSFKAELLLDNAEKRLRPGMIAEVLVLRKVNPKAIAVPLAAVVPDRGEHTVFVVEEGRAARRVVVIDAMVGSSASIAKGVELGEMVVVEGHRGLQDGTPVSVVTDPDE